MTSPPPSPANACWPSTPCAASTCSGSAATAWDVLRFRRWAFFFAVIGANAITIYVAPRFLDFPYFAKFFLGGVYRLSGQYVSGDFRQVVAAAGLLAAEWLFLLYLYWKRIYLRV